MCQKLSIYLFNQHGLSVKNLGTFVLTDFKVFKTEKAQSTGKTGMKAQDANNARKSKFIMPTDKTIGSFFSFESNKVKIECEFTMVRDFFFQQ